jgi:hypothetical protein
MTARAVLFVLYVVSVVLSSMVEDLAEDLSLTGGDGIEVDLLSPDSTDIDDEFAGPPPPDPLALIRRTWKLEPVLKMDRALLSALCSEQNTAPANLAVLFVASSPACSEVSQAYAEMARSYWAELEKRRAVSSSPLFFFQVGHLLIHA